MSEEDAALAQELLELDEHQRVWVEQELARRSVAERIARELGLDAEDVGHILRHLERSPAERLSTGLRHGQFYRPPQPR